MYINISYKFHIILDKQTRFITKVYDLLGQPSYNIPYTNVEFKVNYNMPYTNAEFKVNYNMQWLNIGYIYAQRKMDNDLNIISQIN